MSRGPLKRKDREALGNQIDDISLLRDFYTKSHEEDVRFSSIERMDDISIVDGVTIPDIMVAQRDDGRADLFNRYKVMEVEPEILDEIEVRGLQKEHALVLIEDGMQPQEILESVSSAKMSYPDLASDQMMLMIQNQVEPDLLADIETMGLTCVPLENGKVQVLGLAKIAEVDEEGRTQLSPRIKEQLEAFEQAGMIELEEEMAIEIVELDDKTKGKSKSDSKSLVEGDEQQDEKDLAKDMKEEEELEEEEEKDDVKQKELKVVPLKEKAKAKTQDELEREEIAKELECKPEEVISVIRFSSREVASQFFNNTNSGNTSMVLVRLSNNKFWMMEEDAEGRKVKRQGLEVSPASMLLADKLKDTRHPGDTWVRPGEVKSGKAHENSERYDFFEVMLPGESKTDGASSVMYVGLNANNTQDMRLLVSRNNNVYDIHELSTRSTIPGRAFLRGNNGDRTEIKLRNVKGKDGIDPKSKDLEEQSSMSLNDLSKQQELLIRLELIERAIARIEREAGVQRPEDLDMDEKKPRRKIDPMLLEKKDMTKGLEDLYAQRAAIITQLGLSEADLVKLRDDVVQEQDGPIRGEKRPH